MDFTNPKVMTPNTGRFQPINGDGAPQPRLNHPAKNPENTPSHFPHNSIWIKVVFVIFFLCTVGLVVALLLLLGVNHYSEASYVNTSTYQAVAVATPTSDRPAYYFGKISSLGNSYLVLDDAYELTSSAGQPVRVISLACSSVNDTNQLVFSRAKVIFWDNLAADGNAIQAIQLFNSDNPNGNCATPAGTVSTPSASEPSNSNSPSGNNNSGSTTGTSGGSSTSASSPTSSSTNPATNTTSPTPTK